MALQVLGGSDLISGLILCDGTDIVPESHIQPRTVVRLGATTVLLDDR